MVNYEEEKIDCVLDRNRYLKWVSLQNGMKYKVRIQKIEYYNDSYHRAQAYFFGPENRPNGFFVLFDKEIDEMDTLIGENNLPIIVHFKITEREMKDNTYDIKAGSIEEIE